VHGDLDLAVGLTALLLAPEAFAPLRALGAAHHAGEDAALAAAEARAVLAAPGSRPAVEVDETTRAAPTSPVGRLSVRYPGRPSPRCHRSTSPSGPGSWSPSAAPAARASRRC
jgi:ATP-binding cassette subfamily C protein CydCD